MTDNILPFKQREEADNNCITYDEYGTKMYLYAVDYKYDGKLFSTDIWAYDPEDAKRRVSALRQTATYADQIISKIPISDEEAYEIMNTNGSMNNESMNDEQTMNDEGSPE